MTGISSLLAFTALLAASFTGQVGAHTWIEEMQMISSNGSYVGDRGFSRGYMARTDPGFDGFSNLWLMPPDGAINADGTTRLRINGSDPLCHPSQRNSNYTNPQYPMLQATPGGYIAMKYLENGHVTLPWTLQGKPENGGTVRIYGTTRPKDNEMMVDVMKWTEDSTGGDGRGFLMGSMDYDDGECHQINSCWVSGERQILFPNDIPGQGTTQTERWCESNIKIPESAQAGKLSVYWIWDWGTEAGKDCQAPDGRDQYYTNCADMMIVADGGDTAAGMQKIAAEAGTHTLVQEDPNSMAVKSYASRTAVNKNWAMTTAGNNKLAATPSSAANSSWLSFCATSIIAAQSAAAANPDALPPLCPSGSYAPTGADYTAWASSIKNKAATMAADSPPAATSAPALTTPPASSAPAATSTSAAATSSAPAPAPSQSEASSAAGAGATVTVTQTTIAMSTMTTYAASTPAPSAPAPAPTSAAAAPPASEANTAGFPTVSVISDPSAGMSAAPASGSGAPYNVNAGAGGMGGEHRPPPRRHARAFDGEWWKNG